MLKMKEKKIFKDARISDPYGMALTFRDTGKSWIEDDMLCDQWQQRLHGQKICSPIFRNPEGKFEKFDEYFSIPGLGELFGIIPWSPVD